MIKICFVVTLQVTFNSFLKEFAEYLHKQGNYEISLICNEEGDKSELPPFVKYYPVSMKRGVSLSIFKSMKQIKKIIKENNFDIVQYSTPNAAFCASIAAKKAKTPVRLYCQWGIRYMGFSGLKRKIFKFIEKQTCKNSTFIEVESHNIRNFSLTEKLYKADKSCVIWNGSACGVNLTKFDYNNREQWRKEVREKLGIASDATVFSFAARLTVDKGVNELLEAFREIESQNENVKLIIMGGADNSNKLNAGLIEYAKSSPNVIFTGKVNDVEKYYAASDVFVAPSYREGFGLVVVEAQAMGIPAIVSNVPGQIDAIKVNETGLLCEVKSSKSLKDQMQVFIDNPDKRAAMGLKAKTFVEEEYEQQALFEKLSFSRQKLFKESEEKRA